jgi:probable rRNA maturation factor
LKINVINQQELREINSKKIKDIAKKVLLNEVGEGNFELNILVTDDKSITEFNKYRGKSTPTDVLSFSYGLSEPVIGDIVISVESIEKQAPDFGNSFEEEFYYILIHGLLHIVSYDHENSEEDAKKMFDVQDQYFHQLIKDRRR